jgi:hypothetical protein
MTRYEVHVCKGDCRDIGEHEAESHVVSEHGELTLWSGMYETGSVVAVYARGTWISVGVYAPREYRPDPCDELRDWLVREIECATSLGPATDAAPYQRMLAKLNEPRRE